MYKLARELFAIAMALIEILLVLRFVLKLFSANAISPFVAWIYDATQPLLQPFVFAFPTPSMRGGFVLEFTTLFAIFAYAFIGYVVEQLLQILEKKQT